MSKRRLILLAQVAASVVFIGLIAVFIHPAELWNTLRKANTTLLLLSLSIVPVLMVLRVSRWHIIARTRRPDIPLADTYNSYMAGLAVAVVTPWVGELARGAVVAPRDRAGFMGLTFLDKLIDLTMLFICACVGLMVIAPGGYKAFAAAGIVIAAIAWATLPAMVAIADRVLPRSRMADILRRAALASGQVSRRVLAIAFLLAVANVTIYYCELYVTMMAFSPSIKLEAAALFPLITLSRLIPSLGGLGVREFVAGALFSHAQYDVSSAAAVDASFVQFAFANVVPSVLWLISARGLTRAAALQGERSDGNP